ncbi:MAG: hypothetical protein QW379_07710 [Thermoplasmata archaeon]
MAGDEEVSYNRLIHVYQQEKRGGPPAQLPADFYDSVREFIGALRRACEAERSSDPTSMRALQLTDQLQKARALQMDIVNLRLRKILLLAHQALTGGSVDVRALTPEERSLFDSLVAILKQGRMSVLGETAAPPGAAGPPSPAPTPPADATGRRSSPTEGPARQAVEPLPSRDEAPAASPAPATKTAPSGPPEGRSAEPETRPARAGGLVVLRVVEEVPDFAFGEGGGWRLRPKDIVALPSEIASVLERHGKARAVK